MVDFSVIIATYNRAEYLRECLNSLVSQTHKNFETIIVDDGSTDNTKNVITEFTNLLEIKYIKIPNSGYPAIPRNVGVKHASAEWLCFLDSDDKWTSNKLKICFSFLSDNDVIYHKLKYFGMGKPFYRVTIPSRQVHSPAFTDLLTKGNGIPLSGSMVRKSVFLQVSGFDENILLAAVEDYDLWLKISRITDRFIFIPKILGFYRMHKSSITEHSYKQINKIDFVYTKHLNYLNPHYHEQAAIIKNYYIAVVHERMKNYKEAIALYKMSFRANSYKQKIKAGLRIILIKIKTGIKPKVL